VAPIDVPQFFTGSVGYELPFGRGKIFGGWQVNSIVTLRGGFPTDIRTNVLPPVFNTYNVADRVTGPPMLVDKPRRRQLFQSRGIQRPRHDAQCDGRGHSKTSVTPPAG